MAPSTSPQDHSFLHFSQVNIVRRLYLHQNRTVSSSKGMSTLWTRGAYVQRSYLVERPRGSKS
jgi:hypothetical protein